MNGLPHQPHISRETRLLLATVFLSIFALWMLARVRFPDQPSSTNPVQPLLTQLAAQPAFEELASAVAQVRPRLEPLLTAFGLRIRNDVAVTLTGANGVPLGGTNLNLIGFDLASRLAVVRVPTVDVSPPQPWVPRELQRPRYVVATSVPAGPLSLRPVFVGSLVETESPLWPGPIWLLPAETDLVSGAFAFTIDGSLAGLVVEQDNRKALVPGAVVLAAAERLLASDATVAAGDLGVQVQSLTPTIAKATGASTGVVVAWVDPEGPAATALDSGDVLETANGQTLTTPMHWRVHALGTPAGSALTIRVRRDGQVTETKLVAAPAAQQAGPALGLDLRNSPGAGSVVTDVAPGSAAAAAGLRSGDVITRIARTPAPSPAAIRRAFDRLPAGEAALVGIMRGNSHEVTALQK